VISRDPPELDWAYLEPAMDEEDWDWEEEWDEDWEKEMEMEVRINDEGR